MSKAAGGGSRARALGAMAALSLAMHAGGLYLASRLEPRRPARQEPAVVDFEVETKPPAPPPTPPPPEAQKVEPPPKTPTRRRVAMAKLPPPRAPRASQRTLGLAPPKP